MIDNIRESKTMAKTFRFASDQVLTVDEDKIEKIPYLAAIVSSADHFESVRNKLGHYKLDPHIEYKHFCFALESLSFHSVRQIFNHLPKQNDVMRIIALLDFLGIGPQPDPTLREVDSIFFSNLVYSPTLGKYVQIVRPSVIQNMAVRFAIAMAKEEYDFTSEAVIDQIYWFVMFILSAYELFGPRLRYHVFRIAEHCFSIFKPLLLQSFKKLVLRIKREARNFLSTTNHDDIDPGGDNEHSLKKILYEPAQKWPFFFCRNLKERQELIRNRIYENHYRLQFLRVPDQTKILEPVIRRVVEIMYESLQSEICRRAVIKIHRRKSWINDVKKNFNLEFSFYPWYSEDLPKEICDIWKHELIQKKIRELILEEISVLTPKLEQKRNELVTKIREYEQSHDISHEPMLDIFNFHLFYFNPFHRSSFEILQEEALSYELILDILRQGSSIEEEIHWRVLKALHVAALEQFVEWKNTQQDITKLHDELSSYLPRETFLSVVLSNTIYPNHQVPVNKPKSLPKLQLKYSMRQLNVFRS
ncbi:unnamed protein product [Rotaria sp. Silwood2]|nr:unnamed protein product [Rotaria sp. Silwood2]